jgi:hypothetical protein
VRQFLVADNFLLAATDKGVFRLKSGETSWADLTYNLPVSELGRLALTPQHLWALADGGGVWRLNREGQVAVAPEVQALPFSLSPNPAAHTLSLGLSASREESQWYILDIQGRMLMEGRTAAGQDVQALDVRHLPAGVYVCRVVQGDRFAVKHFVKE